MDVVAGARQRVVTYAQNTAASIDQKLTDQEEKNDLYVSQMFDQVKVGAVKKVLGMMGPATSEMLKPAYAPKRLCDMLDYVHAGIWPEIEAQLEDLILDSVTSSGKKLKQKQLRGWAKEPSLWHPGQRPWRSCPAQPMRYVRAKILYALFPADANKFKHLMDPLATFILCLKVCPVLGINVLLFILVFLLIDRTDESQLVRYILSFKTFQFITGLMAYTKLGVSLLSCLELAGEGEADFTCRDYVPGDFASFKFIMALELVRVLLLIAAGVALAGGGAYGGQEEILALEQVRWQTFYEDREWQYVPVAGGTSLLPSPYLHEYLLARVTPSRPAAKGTPTGSSASDSTVAPESPPSALGGIKDLIARVTPTRSKAAELPKGSGASVASGSDSAGYTKGVEGYKRLDDGDEEAPPAPTLTPTKEGHAPTMGGLLARVMPTRPASEPAKGSDASDSTGKRLRFDDAPTKGGQAATATRGGQAATTSGSTPLVDTGTLHVHLVSAAGLKSADSNGKSDPYVRLLLAGQRVRSKTIMKTLDPQWDEHFEFVGGRQELLKQSLHLQVFDYDRLSMDDKLGVAQVELEPLLHATDQDPQWSGHVTLSVQGSVHLHLRWASGPPTPRARGEGGAEGAARRGHEKTPVLVARRRLVTKAEYKASIASARLKYGVQRRLGGFLPYFMAYDVVVVVSLLLYLGLKCLHLHSQGAPEWLLWMSCFNVKTVWALLGFPFMVFAFPVVGDSLHRAKPTAYDQAGLLVPALSGSDMKQRIALEEEEAAEAQVAQALTDETSGLTGAALRIQKIRRGNEARKRTGARFMRHLVVQTPVGFFISANEIEKWFN